MERIREGAASIGVGGGVFYNPKMGKLRDISILLLRAAKIRKAKLLDATAATGIRGIRYALEAGVVDTTMLDINSAAYRNAKANARLNRVKANVLGKSLQDFAGSAQRAFDAIDLDPFGSPAPLVYDALRLSKDGTILMVTATDTATLCGAEGSACQRIYGAKPIHNELCHEGGVRILLNFIARNAGQFNFGIEPLLSIADMHYMRVFVRLHRGAREATASVGSGGFVAYCSRCHNFAYKKGVVAQPDTTCNNCGARMQAYGPMWLGALKDAKLVSEMAALSSKYGEGTKRFVTLLNEELDIPFFYSVPKATSYLKMGSIPIDKVVNALGKRHSVSRTHFEKDVIKTTAGIGDVLAAVAKAK